MYPCLLTFLCALSNIEVNGLLATQCLSRSTLYVQLQQDELWSSWVEMAFTKLDSNGDGFIDLEELISKLPVEAETDTATRNERLLEVRCIAYRRIALTAVRHLHGN